MFLPYSCITGPRGHKGDQGSEGLPGMKGEKGNEINSKVRMHERFRPGLQLVMD